jgi:hypothetical protein
VSFSAEQTRCIGHHQDLVLVVLLTLDETGHGLASGSVPDLADMASHGALAALELARLIVRSDTDGLELTDAGRAEARLVAKRLAGPS